MKSLNKYINESAEFELIKTEYREYGVVTLIRRENIDCSTLSKDEFVNLMNEDLHKAIEEYGKVIKPLNDEKLKKFIDVDINKAINFAEKKYKSQKKRDEYIENARKNTESKKYLLEDYKRITFDLRLDKNDISMSEYLILNINTTKDQLEKCFNEIKDNRYFKKAIGWAFKYESNNKEKIGYYSYRPYIDLLLNETSKEEEQRDTQVLTQSVKDFYTNSKYWGD